MAYNGSVSPKKPKRKIRTATKEKIEISKEKEILTKGSFAVAHSKWQ